MIVYLRSTDLKSNRYLKIYQCSNHVFITK